MLFLASDNSEIRDGHRAAVEVSLKALVAERDQRIALLGRLDALGDDLQAEGLAQGDDRGGDRRIVGIAMHIGDEAAIDFYLVDRQTLQVVQRRVTRAEIIERQADTQFPLELGAVL